MSTAVKFTYDQYQEMIRIGLFVPPEAHRVELIFGEIVPIDPGGPMSPINPPHDDAVDEFIAWSREVLPIDAARIRAQGAIGIPELDSQPQPDFVWMSPRRFNKIRPVPEDIFLLVEVSDTTLSKDRGDKVRLYAAAGIREYWLVNINGRCIEVRRNSVGDTYQDVKIFTRGQEIRPLAFPDIVLPVSRIFPD